MALEVFIDGVDVSSVALEGSWTPRLNRPRQAQVRIPMSEKESFMQAGAKLKIVLDGTIVFHGFIQVAETTADEDSGYTVFNAEDVMEIWRWRPVRDEDGDYSYPTIIEDHPNAPTVIEQMIINSETAIASADHGDADGTLFLDYSAGPFPVGGVDISGAPVDWPMTMMELASLLCSTGELDIVLTPIDSGGNMASIATYHGDYGVDRQGSVIFEYGTGGAYHNIRSFRHVTDMSNLVNKLRYLLGPRTHPPADPKSFQHWEGSIETGGTNQPDPPRDAIFMQQHLSQNQYGTRFDIKIFDNREIENNFRDLFYRLWFSEAWLRATPRTLLHITPTRDTEINTFNAGDIVGVNIYGTALAGGVFGAQRVYEYTISWDQDSVLTLSELQTSADNEDFPG